jgi:hypothetical protein
MNIFKFNIFVVLFFFIIVDNIYTFCFSEFLEFLSNDKSIFKGNGDEVNNDFFLIIVLVPFFETLIFQYIVIWSLYNITENIKTPVIISTFLFAASHFSNIYYFIATIGSGFILSILFISVYKKTNKWAVAFTLTFLLHLEHNLVSFYFDN